jgi:hypothetical protein
LAGLDGAIFRSSPEPQAIAGASVRLMETYPSPPEQAGVETWRRNWEHLGTGDVF